MPHAAAEPAASQRPQPGPGRRSTHVAAGLRALVGASACLVVDPAGPDSPRPLPGAGPRILWQRWGAGAADGADQTLAGAAVADEALAVPDLVICDERGVARDDGEAASLVNWLVAVASPASGRIAIVSGDERSGPAPEPRWARLLAAHGYSRVFDRNLELVPVPVALYVGDDGSSLDARHSALVEEDRIRGLLARTMTLQYEVDYWRTKCEVQAADNRRATRQLQRIERSRSYRIGLAIAKPFRSASRRKGGPTGRANAGQ